MPFAVIDFETTGLTPARGDRAIEIGLVLADDAGRIEAEWTTLLNPRRHVGASHIHGLTGADLYDAPEFDEVAPYLVSKLAGRTLVAHNAPFDMRFLHSELDRTAHALPEAPAAFCSMRWAGRLVGPAKLAHCCDALGIEFENAHSALADARATAALLEHLLRLGSGHDDFVADVLRGRSTNWTVPVAQGQPRSVARGSHLASPHQWLDDVLTAAWIPGSPEDEAAYLLVLDRALLDGKISRAEGDELLETARSAGLTERTINRLHRQYLDAVAVEAWADGVVTEAEFEELRKIAVALRLDDQTLQRALDAGENPAAENDATAGFRLDVGDRVVFTGQLSRDRDELVAQIVEAGLTSGSVTKSTKLLVAEDQDSMSGKARRARELGIAVVDEATFNRLFSEYLDLINADDTTASSVAATPAPPTGTSVSKVPDSDSPIVIEASIAPMISYAMAHNRIPFVDALRIEGLDPALGAVDVTVEVAERDRKLSADFSQRFELDATGTIELPRPSIRLDPAAMSMVEDRRPGSVTITVSSHEEALARREIGIDVLAARQWLRSIAREHASYELLAAHVLPNDPALLPLIEAARERLEAATGSSATEGYQLDAQRVDQIVEAIYESARALGISYSNPPASWHDEGQKVRTPAEVLEGRVGTCLDTTVLLAAALEHVGINSLLFIVEGHAFLGYFREEATMGAVARSDLSSLRNAVDLRLIGLIETTALTDREDSGTLSNRATHERPRKDFLSADMSRAYAATDILEARRVGITPLPAVSRDLDGNITVTEYRPLTHTGVFRAVESSRVNTAVSSSDRQAPPRVQRWKNALLDLSLRNRLINFSQRGAVSLAVPEAGLATLEDRLNAGIGINLMPSDALGDVAQARGTSDIATMNADAQAQIFDARNALMIDVSSAAYTTRLRNLAYKAKTIVEETGANNLYVALGSLRWQQGDRELKSPLILVPVHLKATRDSYRIELDDSGSSTPNFCLLEKLKVTDRVTIPGLENPVEDEHGIDLEATLQAVRTSIAEAGLPYRVDATADLAILQFAKFRLWQDLDDHWSDLADNPLVKHLIGSPTDPFEDPVPASDPSLDELDALDASCPIPADSSQLLAVASALRGNTFVLEGPPGTGKSQTITNLLAKTVAAGKRVLFVAEKRAALDVVSDRLDAIGMGVFALDLHDKSARPTAVRRQIKNALDHVVTVDRQGLEADLDALRSSRRALAKYADRLHSPNSVGLSFYESRTQLLTGDDEFEALAVAPGWVTSASADAPDRVRSALLSLTDVADPARPRRLHPWGFLRRIPSADASAILAAAQAVDHAWKELSLRPEERDFLVSVDNPAQLRGAVSFLSNRGVSVRDLEVVATDSWHASQAAFLAKLDAFVNAPHPAMEYFEPKALEYSLITVRDQVTAAAASGFFGRKKRIFAALEPLQQFARPDSQLKPKMASAIVNELVELQMTAAGLAPSQSGVVGLTDPLPWNPFSPEAIARVRADGEWLEWAAKTLTAHDDFAQQIRTLLEVSTAPTENVESLRRFEAAFLELAELTGRRGHDFDRWRGETALIEAWVSSEPARSAEGERGLARWLRFIEALEPLRELKLDEAVEQLVEGTVDADDAPRAFQLGLAQASLTERGEETGLREFDALTHAKMLSRFSSSLQSVRGQLVDAVPDEVLSARRFDPRTSRGRVGALQRELNRQRGGLKVREMLAEYGDLITEIMPCVLVSPDSLARFFSVGSQKFDVVVFDEASQIRVAEAIGALGRAESAIIVGDSKQMPPTSVAESSFASDDADAEVANEFAVEDEESILSEAVMSRVDRQWLTWHYRSRNESLIAFSNHHYYESKLSSFPSPTREDSFDSGVRLIRVDGQFIRERGPMRGTNPVEAQAIVDHVMTTFEKSPDALPSLGVVTFNLQQRALIEGMLRDLDSERIREALDGANGEGLFVKNLENVQGDERDVILFSTAFSKDASGKLPLNFGPLNKAGGERRLNVAVTRARVQVLMFSSFDPADLRAEQTQSVGIKHLRTYLDMAAAGAEAVTGPSSPTKTSVDRHRDDIADTLRAKGLKVSTDVGLSTFKIDLVIFNPDDPTAPSVAVLLDGPGWADRRTTGDRDGLPTSVLGSMLKWPRVERVWMPEWIEDRDLVVQRLFEAASSTPEIVEPEERVVPVAPIASSYPKPQEQFAARPAPLEAPTRIGEPFEPWVPSSAGDRSWLDRLPEPDAKRRVWEVQQQILTAEGPVRGERLARLTAEAFDLTRLSDKRIRSILAAVPRRLKDSHDFVWADGAAQDDWPPVRSATTEAPRPVLDVHPRELVTAIATLVRAASGMTVDEVYKEVLGVYGWQKRTAALTAPIQVALELGVEQGRLAITEDGLVTE